MKFRIIFKGVCFYIRATTDDGLLLGVSIHHVSQKPWHIAGMYKITINILNNQGKKSKGTTRLGICKRCKKPAPCGPVPDDLCSLFLQA